MNCSLPGQNVKILGKAIQTMAKLPGEDIFVEAEDDGLRLRTVNSSRSGYVCFQFKREFFIRWSTVPVANNKRIHGEDDDETNGNYCRISMKSALIIYKATVLFDKTVEMCLLSIDTNAWHLIFELQCKSGVIRKYKISLLTCPRISASFDKASQRNIIAAPAKLLVDGIQKNFQAGQDEVTLNARYGELNLRNYVEDAPDPEKVLKTQLHFDRGEFEQYEIEEESDLTFCLKELRALLSFVEAYSIPVVIRFEQPGKPVMFSVESDPAFVGDLVLATLIEPEVSTQATHHISSQSSHGIASITTDNSTLPRDSQGRISALGVRRVSVCASLLSPVANKTGDISMDISRNDTPVERSHRPASATENKTVNSLDTDSLGIESIYNYDEDLDSMEDDEEVMPSTPPRKRARVALFHGWSQNTVNESEMPTQKSDDKCILARDSDLEDY